MSEVKKIKEDISWIGVKDFGLKVFDIVMKAEHGTTYNSYVVKGSEKTALVETVKENFFDEYKENVKSQCNFEDIDYIIVNHTEPDHSGSVLKTLEICKNATVLCTRAAKTYLDEMINGEYRVQIVNDGDEISLGNKTIKFITAPCLHWPDTMFSYLKEYKILFTCDFLGSHYSFDGLFNDEVTDEVSFENEFEYYYECIMHPYKDFVLKAIDKIKDLEIDVICNGHGPVMRANIEKYLTLYKVWSTKVKGDKPTVILAYVSAYGYTGTLSDCILKGFGDKVTTKFFDMENNDLECVAKEMEMADAVIFGTPTILGDALPPIHDLVTRLNPVINKGKLVGVFGASGWSGEGVDIIENRLRQLKMNIPVESIKVKFKPTEEDMEKSKAFGVTFANCLLEKFNSK